MKMDKGTFENHLRLFAAGAVVFREDDPGCDMFLIIQGAVEIRKATVEPGFLSVTESSRSDPPASGRHDASSFARGRVRSGVKSLKLDGLSFTIP